MQSFSTRMREEGERIGARRGIQLGEAHMRCCWKTSSAHFPSKSVPRSKQPSPNRCCGDPGAAAASGEHRRGAAVTTAKPPSPIPTVFQPLRPARRCREAPPGGPQAGHGSASRTAIPHARRWHKMRNRWRSLRKNDRPLPRRRFARGTATGDEALIVAATTAVVASVVLPSWPDTTRAGSPGYARSPRTLSRR
jgi:hypothetical protein